MSTNAESLLRVRVQPGFWKGKVFGFRVGEVHIRVSARRERDKTYAAMIMLFADVLYVAKRKVVVVRGSESRIKLAAIKGTSPEQIWGRLHGSQQGPGDEH